ncbi:hypothetical protein CYY_003180 [Polysphondylium violaceum]|uniref:Uncharacterized protein n=1 Tax=Polysphondylium violaceum TaxID=133409 RepID=A0A8J4V8Z3_9MYCE|nr:hypothetical protein CYY_003180 [Polysphondylium violaceum]
MVRAKILANISVSVGLDQLARDRDNPLYTLSPKNKLDNNIFLKLTIYDQEDIENYRTHSQRHKANSVTVRYPKESDEGDESFDLHDLCDGVHRLTFEVGSSAKPCQGALPNSITDLCMTKANGLEILIDQFFVSKVISTLPTSTSIQSLTLPKEYRFTSRFVVPSSLVTLNYESVYDSLQWLVVSPGQVLNNCTIDIKSIEDFVWLEKNIWITCVALRQQVCDIVPNLIPQHVSKVEIEYDNAEIQEGTLPKMLQALICYNEIFFPKPVLPLSLKHVELKKYPRKLEKDILPAGIQHLLLCGFNETLEPDVLPSSLTKLLMYDYDQVLHPFVLPQGITELNLFRYKQPTFLSHSLPAALVKLEIQIFQGSFDSLGALDNLRHLAVFAIDDSLSILLANVKKLKLWTSLGFRSGSLYDTSIEDLYIYSYQRMAIASPTLLPQHLKRLKAIGFDINKDILPPGCKLAR